MDSIDAAAPPYIDRARFSPVAMGTAARAVELRHFWYMTVAAEQGSFRGAAASTGVPVSTISRSIRDLEDEVGTALFIRRPSGVTLTFAGERFLGHARKVLDHANKAIRAAGIAGTGHAGRLRIGMSSTLASGFLNRLVRIYEAAYAAVRLAYSEGKTADHLSALRRGRLDVSFLIFPPSSVDCDAIPLWEERVTVALAENDPLAGKEEIAWEDLRGRHFLVNKMPPGPEIHDFLERHFMQSDGFPGIEPYAVSFDSLMELVAGGSGVTLMGEARTKVSFPRVVYRPLTGETFSFHAVWSPANGNPAFRRFLSLAKILAKRCANCPFRDGLENPSSTPDEDGATEGKEGISVPLISLLKVMSKRCAACMVTSGLVD